MKFQEILRFEFAYQIRSPLTWIFFLLLVILNFLMTRDATLSEALFEEFLVNSPFAIAKTTVFGNLLWLVMAAFITGDAAARDRYTSMHPLFYTLPMHKAHYLGGKFFAAMLLNACMLAAVQLAIMLAIYLPGVDPTLIGPFSIAPYLTAYTYIGLPTAFAATCIQFTFSVVTGKPMASYGGSVLLVFMGFFVASLLLFNRGLGTLLDPIGIRFVVEDMSHLWTTVEKNYRLVEFKGVILENRILWIGVGILFLVLTYFRFQFKHVVVSDWRILPKWKFKKKLIKDESDLLNRKSLGLYLPSDIAPSFALRTWLYQTVAIAWSSFKTLAFSWAGLAMLIAIPLLTILIVIDQLQPNSGVLAPTSIRVIRELTAPLSAELSRWVIIPAFIIFFAGEVVWREREARMGELTDTMPGSEWTPLLGKVIAIILMLLAFTSMQMIAGILAQLVSNYTDFEISLYLKILFGFQFTEYALFSILVVAVHVVVDQKYMAHMVAIIMYVFIVLSQLFGVGHSMLVFGAGPAWNYTDMRGFGNSVAPWLCFKLYWAAWTILIAVVAKLFWTRGARKNLMVRVKLAKQRLTPATKITAIFSMSLIAVSGSFIFYNINILHEYLTEDDMKARQAEYEQRYGKSKSSTQPQITNATLKVEFYTREKKAEIIGTYVLVNLDSVNIDSIHITTTSAPATKIVFDRKIKSTINDPELSHSIYTLDKALLPGDSLKLTFEMTAELNGFSESGADNSMVANGSFFSNNWFPSIGYKESRELLNAKDRRDYKLPPRPIIASLYNVAARGHHVPGITFDCVVGTDQDQTAGAPGKLIRHWTEKNRNYFHYKTDGEIGNEWAFFSANYSFREEIWRASDSKQHDVTIQIFHMPEHTGHLDRMIQSIRASLAYYSKNFGRYPYNHLTIAEAPGEGTGLHADASMLTHSEGFSLWKPEDDSLRFDFPFAVVAHEMAHQWTVPYASVEGAPVMSESIAWYYAIKLVEHAKGPAHVKKLLADMRQPYPYPPIKRGEPLLRGLDPYLSYRRGPFALYTLSEYVGDEKINQGLRHLLETHRTPRAPLATTLDLYHKLESVTPDSLHYLLHDLFEVNTYWKLRIRNFNATKTQADVWSVQVDLDATKIVADSAGVEKEIPMNDWVEIGVFAENSETLYLKKHLIRSGRQSLNFDVSKEPKHAGFDPNHLLIDLKPEDNFKEIGN